MQRVAEKIVQSTHFAGRNFSMGDHFIENIAMRSAGPGNATSWRSVNTVHHLTRVIRDLGEYYGYRLRERTGATGSQQEVLPF
jgi:hypothetical protein